MPQKRMSLAGIPIHAHVHTHTYTHTHTTDRKGTLPAWVKVICVPAALLSTFSTEPASQPSADVRMRGIETYRLPPILKPGSTCVFCANAEYIWIEQCQSMFMDISFLSMPHGCAWASKEEADCSNSAMCMFSDYSSICVCQCVCVCVQIDTYLVCKCTWGPSLFSFFFFGFSLLLNLKTLVGSCLLILRTNLRRSCRWFRDFIIAHVRHEATSLVVGLKMGRVV